MNYPIVPHPRIITGTGSTVNTTYVNTGRSAYARLSSGVRTFVTRTIPNFARRVFSGIYQVAKFLYRVTVHAGKYVWNLAGQYSKQLLTALKNTPQAFDKAGKVAQKAVTKTAKATGKVVGGAVRRVKDFNTGFAEGLAGDPTDYVNPKFKQQDSVNKFGARRVERAHAKGARRQKAVAGVAKRALMGAEIAGGLKLVSSSIAGIDIMAANGFSVNLKKKKKGE